MAFLALLVMLFLGSVICFLLITPLLTRFFRLLDDRPEPELLAQRAYWARQDPPR